MTYAVHSLHAPAVLLVGGGYSLDGRAVIQFGEPLHVAQTIEESESWRVARLQGSTERNPPPPGKEG